MPSTCGLVAMTSPSHGEGRQFDPGQVYICICDEGEVTSGASFAARGHRHASELKAWCALMTLAGPEPAIFGSEGQHIIH